MKELINVTDDKEEKLEKGKDNSLFPENSINIDEAKPFFNDINDIQIDKPLMDTNEIRVKDTGYYKKCILNLIKNKTLIGFILLYSLYLMSLEGCYLGEDVCTNEISYIVRKIIEEVISCIIFIFMFQLMIFKIISKWHLIHVAIIFFLFYLYSHGLEFPDHGYFNFVYYFIMFGVFTIILIPFDIILCFLKKNKNNKIIVVLYFVFLIIVSIVLYFYLIVYRSNCDDWAKGLNNTYIENDKNKYGCQIIPPKRCVYKILDNVQDYTKIFGKECSKYSLIDKKQLFKYSKSPYINENTKLIGIPLTNKDPICFQDFTGEPNLIRKHIMSNLVDMENKKILEEHFKDKIPEVVIDYTDDDRGKYIIDVHFNKTLSEERKKLEKNVNPYSENLMIIYIDSVSRGNSLRHLRKTLSFFEKFISYKGGSHEKYPSENYHSFQFFKYQAFDGFTTNNYPLMFYGKKKEELNKTFFTKYFKENGYITSHTHDLCLLDSTRANHNYTIEEVFDHQMVVCDPDNDHISLTSIRCLHGKQNMEYFLDYTDQFWRKYPNNRKLSAIISNYGHEGTLNVVKYIDDMLYNFINNLFNDHLLKDTSIILISDHGAGMPSVYYTFDFYKKEIFMPMLYIWMNDRKNVTYEEQYGNLFDNQQTYITHLDIYNTLIHFLYGDKYNEKNTTYKGAYRSELGISIFNKINPKERYQEKYTHIYSISITTCKRETD
jgi:hypothetical protein